MTQNYDTATTSSTVFPSLLDRTVLVTGGANGIGASIVEAFALQGSRVGFLDLDREAASFLCDKFNAVRHKPTFEYCDIRDVDKLKKAIKDIGCRIGAVDILINNAANDERFRLDEITPGQWDDLQSSNLRHIVFASQAVQTDMAKKGKGSIINFSSPTFRRRTAKTGAYATAKAGIEGLSRIMSREMGEKGIRVNTIMPGWTMTERQRNLWLTPEAEELLLETQCLKTHVMPDDIAKMVLFLSSDDARVITAQTFIVDAGLV